MHIFSLVIQESCILRVTSRRHAPAGGAAIQNIMKSRRQGAILDLIDREPLTSQEQVRKELLAEGFEATQATISRDIKQLGLVKRAGDGAYQRPGAEALNPATVLTALERAAGEFVRRV